MPIKKTALSSFSIYFSDPSIYLSIDEDQQAEMSSNLGEWIFSGFVFDWLFRARGIADGTSERKQGRRRKRENERERERGGEER